MRSFEELAMEAEQCDMTGWDFGWLSGRATEERPPWGFTSLLAERPELTPAGGPRPPPLAKTRVSSSEQPAGAPGQIPQPSSSPPAGRPNQDRSPP